MAAKSWVPEFGRPVQRSYPYKWFPWAVCIGGILITVIFSLINFAANGYQLEILYTNNPNRTLAQETWYSHWPLSWFEKVVATCQSQNIQANSQFFTDKLSLPYTITSIYRNQTSLEVLPSFQYMNNMLEQCTVNEMVLNIESASRTANQQSFYTWGIEASAMITCLIHNGGTSTWLNLSTAYDYITPWLTANPGLKGAAFLQLDDTTKTSLWWGQSLLGWYYLSLASHIESVQNDPSSNDVLTKLTFRNEPRGNHPASGLADLMFFHNVDKVVVNGDGVHYGTDNWTPNYLSSWPQIFPEADLYAKILYSCILADLGNSVSKNILTDPVLLQNYTQDFHEPSVLNQDFTWDYMGPAFDSFNNTQPPAGPLRINDSTIYAEYFCQVPRRKPAGSLIIAIVVADLVFLQAAWKILNWATTKCVEHSDPRSAYCEGCLIQMDKGHELEPAAVSTKTGAHMRGLHLETSADERSLCNTSREPLLAE